MACRGQRTRGGPSTEIPRCGRGQPCGRHFAHALGRGRRQAWRADGCCPLTRAAGIRSSAASPRTVAASGLASELTARGASTTETMLAGNWKTARMVAHYAAGATAERGAVANRPARMRRVTTPMTHAPMMSGAGRRPCLGCGAGRFRGRGWLRCDDAYPARQGSAWVDIESLPATLTPLFPSPHLFTTRVVGEAGVPPQCTVATGPKRSVCFWSGPWPGPRAREERPRARPLPDSTRPDDPMEPAHHERPDHQAEVRRRSDLSIVYVIVYVSRHQ